MPQAYAEVGNQTFSVKVGHFYTIIGYEGVPSINNFFYSKSYAYQFAGPFTHWGGLATWHVNDRVTLQGTGQRLGFAGSGQGQHDRTREHQVQRTQRFLVAVVCDGDGQRSERRGDAIRNPYPL